MGEVISLFQPAVASGPAFCFSCQHDWTAVAPVGTYRFECPKCKRMTGMFKFEFVPPEDTLVFTCECGNQLFYLTKDDGRFCPSCGSYHRHG